jgi:hypothetical protein
LGTRSIICCRSEKSDPFGRPPQASFGERRFGHLSLIGKSSGSAGSASMTMAEPFFATASPYGNEAGHQFDPNRG